MLIKVYDWKLHLSNIRSFLLFDVCGTGWAGSLMALILFTKSLAAIDLVFGCDSGVDGGVCGIGVTDFGGEFPLPFSENGMLLRRKFSGRFWKIREKKHINIVSMVS